VQWTLVWARGRSFDAIGARVAWISMLARRLLALAALLLVIGALSAALAPRELRSPTKPAGPPATTTATPSRADSAGSVRSSLRANAKPPPVARARLGDLVDLFVAVAAPTTLTLDGYGAVKPGDQDTPAHFNLIAYRAGDFAVHDTTGAIVARLAVAGGS